MAKHISQVRSEPFDRAMKASLARLVDSKQPFSIQDVVSGARYDDGTPVGSTSIYGKYNGRQKHAALLVELRAAVRRSHASTNVDSANSAADASSGLLKQLLTQEDRILELERRLSVGSNVVSRLQDELFVALRALNEIGAGTIPEINRKTEELRQQIASEELHAALEAKAKSWAQKVKLRSAFVGQRIFGNGPNG